MPEGAKVFPNKALNRIAHKGTRIDEDLVEVAAELGKAKVHVLLHDHAAWFQAASKHRCKQGIEGFN